MERRVSLPATAGDERAMPPPMRILLIDDDPFVLDSMTMVLELDGHTIVAMAGGRAGIEAFRMAKEKGEPFSLVLTDLGMPEVDGSQVARAVKGLSPSTPVILLTGWGRRLTPERDGPNHVDFTLSKPPQLPELRKTLLLCSGFGAAR